MDRFNLATSGKLVPLYLGNVLGGGLLRLSRKESSGRELPCGRIGYRNRSAVMGASVRLDPVFAGPFRLVVQLTGNTHGLLFRNHYPHPASDSSPRRRRPPRKNVTLGPPRSAVATVFVRLKSKVEVQQNFTLPLRCICEFLWTKRIERRNRRRQPNRIG